VPFIFWCPSKFAGGQVVDETISLVDIMPTVLALAGLQPPEGIQGRSLVSALAGQPVAEGRLILSETDGAVERTGGFTLALTGDRYKLIETRVGQRKREIFDTTADPGERLDLSTTRPELLELFQPAFDEALAIRSGATGARAPEPRDIDPSLRERLRALGYEP
jgi:arylsulfatase A-like enzyme